MDDVQQLTGTLADALRSIGLELTSLRLLLQFGLILLAAVVGTLAASLIRRRLDLTALTLGWPPFLREFARLLLANLGTIIFVLLVAIAHAVTDLAEPVLPARRRIEPGHRLGGDRAGRRPNPAIRSSIGWWRCRSGRSPRSAFSGCWRRP